ncbi:alpha/beta fold hydrolase [Hirschia litorea]|uniref:Alpha/beta fold hydrolase n=1 Tax=Hirschia litorea TaxID=1199156 RepID=A0ABW2ILC6_9PROT
MFDRRVFLSGVSALSFTMISGCQTMPNAPRRTYILVHGAWHGGWCWKDVKSNLERDGHRVYTPTLSGLGENFTPRPTHINLTTHVQDIVSLIETENLSNVTLVGHSYAGVVVSLVADKIKSKIDHLIYVDAVIPEDGKAFFPQPQQDEFLKLYQDDYVLPIGSLEFLGIPEDHPKVDWVLENLTPHPLGCFLEKVHYTQNGPDGLPKTYIRCTGNPRFKDDPIKTLAENNAEWRYRIIDTGHDAMVTAPDELSQMLELEHTR